MKNFTKLFLSYTLTAAIIMAIFTSCGGNDTVPPVDTTHVKPTVKIDTVTYKVTDTKYLSDNITAMETNSTDTLKVLFFPNIGNFGLTTAQRPLIARLNAVGAMLNAGAVKNVKQFDKANSVIYPATDKDKLTFADWVNVLDKWAIGKGPNGEMFGVDPLEVDAFITAGVKKELLYVILPEGAVNTTIATSADFNSAKADEIKGYLAQKHQVIVNLGQNILLTATNMPLAMALANDSVTWTGAGSFIAGGVRVVADGNVLSKLKIGNNPSNSNYTFYVTNDKNPQAIANRGVKFYTNRENLSDESLSSSVIADTLDANVSIIDANILLKYKGEKGITKSNDVDAGAKPTITIIPLIVPDGGMLALNNFSTAASATMRTKAIVEFYNVCSIGNPNATDVLYHGMNSPFAVVNKNGDYADVTVNSMHIGKNDTIYEGYYVVNKVDIGSGSFQILEKSYDITKKAPKITTDGQTNVNIAWNKSLFLCKSANYSTDSPTTEIIFSTDFYKKISAILGLTQNGLYYAIYTPRMFTQYEDDATAAFNNFGPQPNRATEWLKPYNMSVATPDGLVPASSASQIATSMPNIAVRMANGWKIPSR